MNGPSYEFLKEAGRISNSGQSKSLILSGNVSDLFHVEDGGEGRYLPLVDLLSKTWDVENKIIVVYELNGPIRFYTKGGLDKVRSTWSSFQGGIDPESRDIKLALATTQKEIEQLEKNKEGDLNSRLATASKSPTYALELLRQLCLCSRSVIGGKRLLEEDLVVIIEAADMVIPEGDIARLSDVDRQRVSICRDWFSDLGFMSGNDLVVLISESKSLINHLVSRLPPVLEVVIPSPDQDERTRLISWFDKQHQEGKKLKLWGSSEELAKLSAGLSNHALVQLMVGACYGGKQLTPEDVISKVESFIKDQLGEDVVEFKKPSHGLKDVVGFSKLKKFFVDELIPRIKSTGPGALPGAAVCGPNGGGKTFLFEAVAGELGIVVIVLKNIRSQWFGQTDVMWERLRRILEAIGQALIFVDEADTQFGGVGKDTHETERRLTGKVQAMMSDPRLRGKIFWLLITARIHLLSPDLRRPGRAGSLIIPILDPEGDDRKDFLRWLVKPVVEGAVDKGTLGRIDKETRGSSAAFFADLRSDLISRSNISGKKLSVNEIMSIIDDRIPPAIELAREYQTLQALVNCTRKSLLPDPNVGDEQRKKWLLRIKVLEAEGID